MGFFKDLVSKKGCELCGKEVGALSREKLKDGLFICSDCRNNCSKFFSPTLYTLEDVKKHIEYMKLQEELYNREFVTLPDDKKITTVKLFPHEGITFADDLAMFEVVISKNKEQRIKELFRYDDIYDFRVYTKNAPEGSNKKYSEVGIEIRFMLDVPNLMDYHTYHYIHKYVKTLQIPLERNVDSLDVNNLAYKHMKVITGCTIESNVGSIDKSKDIKYDYRDIEELKRDFDKTNYTKIADEVERRVWGKTASEMFDN